MTGLESRTCPGRMRLGGYVFELVKPFWLLCGLITRGVLRLRGYS